MEHLNETGKFFKKCKYTKLTQNKVENHSPISIKESIFLCKKRPIKKTLVPDCFTGKFYYMFKEEICKTYKLFQKNKGWRDTFHLFFKSA